MPQLVQRAHVGPQIVPAAPGLPPVSALVGPSGSGKSHHLRLAAEQARLSGQFVVVNALRGNRPDALVPRLASAIVHACPLGQVSNSLAAPRWVRQLVPLAKRARGSNPRQDAEELARALNANAPALLLLDDLHGLPISRASDHFLETMAFLPTMLAAENRLLWTADVRQATTLAARFPGLDVPKLPIRPMPDGDALELVARRLQASRMSEDVDPLYPFTRSAVVTLNRAVNGNPGRLLRLCELLVESTLHEGAYTIDQAKLDALLLHPALQRLLPQTAQ